MAKATTASRGNEQFMLRLPDGMRDLIRASAAASGRSMNSELLHRLQGSSGVTLREHYAGLAMQGMVAHPDNWGQATDGIAYLAVDLADALIAELAKGGEA
jgi:hypothetical protein